MKSIILALTFTFVCSAIFAQEGTQAAPQPPTKTPSGAIALDPTGKRFMKPRERTKYGGPAHNTLSIEKRDTNVNITFIEIQLDPSSKGGLDVTARGTKTTKLNGCEFCTVAGRLIVNEKAGDFIESISKEELVVTKQEKNKAACRAITFKSAENKDYTVVTSPEGGFMLSTIPNGNYSIWVGGKKVITDYILKTIPVKLPPATNPVEEAEKKQE